MRPGRALALIVGCLAAIVALALVAGGAALLWVHGTQRDDNGYYTTSTEQFTTATYALTSDPIDVGTDVGARSWVPSDIGTALIRATATSQAGVFVGIAPAADVERYLAATAHDEVTDVDFDPFEPTYLSRPGSAPPAPPADQPFWVASTSGPGTQTLTWEIDSGEWAVVLMNADGSPGVTVDTSVGIKTGLLLPMGIALVAFGLVVGSLATVLVVVGTRRERSARGTGEPAIPTKGTAPGGYPLRISGELDEPLSRGLWLVKWFLAIPHFVVLAFLWAAFVVLTVVAGFAILLTGRYPRPIFDFNVGVLRWTWRVTFYALNLGTDRYPPFSLAVDDGYPARLEVDYPAELSRPLVLVKWWLLALPHYLVVSIFGGGLTWWWTWGDQGESRLALGLGLIGVLVLIAGVTLLFTRRYPRSLFDFVVGMERWSYRVSAYAGLMTDRYPPFRLDTGGPEPEAAPPAPPRSEGGAGDSAPPAITDAA